MELTKQQRIEMAFTIADMKSCEVAEEIRMQPNYFSRLVNAETHKDALIKMISIATNVPFEWIKDGTGNYWGEGEKPKGREPIIEQSVSFGELKAIYPNRKDIVDAFFAWVELSGAEKEKAFKYVPKYLKDKNLKQLPLCVEYLTEKEWSEK